MTRFTRFNFTHSNARFISVKRVEILCTAARTGWFREWTLLPVILRDIGNRGKWNVGAF